MRDGTIWIFMAIWWLILNALSVVTIRIKRIWNYSVYRCRWLILILSLTQTLLLSGIINRFRLSKRCWFEPWTGVQHRSEGKFDGEHGGKPDYDGILGATLGWLRITGYLRFQRPVPQIISELELNQMRNQMNAMAAANMQLQQQLANAPAKWKILKKSLYRCQHCTARTVFFKIGSDKLSPTRKWICISCQQDKRIPNADLYNQRICWTLQPVLLIYQPEVKSGTCTSCKDLLVKNMASLCRPDCLLQQVIGVDKFGQPIPESLLVLVNQLNNTFDIVI